MSADGKIGGFSGRYSDLKKSGSESPSSEMFLERDPTIVEMSAEIRNQGREIAEMKATLSQVDQSLREINTSIIKINVQMQHLVTKEDCTKSRTALSNNLKDRMDGEREITGINVTVPELWSKQKNNKNSKSSKLSNNQDSTKKNHRVLYWITIGAALITLVGAGWGILSFVSETLERQERTEQVLISIEERLSKAN